MLRMLNPDVSSRRESISSPEPVFLFISTKNPGSGLVCSKSLKFKDFLLLCIDSELASFRVLGAELPKRVVGS